MTATSSNLSDARYGYDFVCAITQDSINATMKEQLPAAQTTDISACYVIDPATNAKVLKPLSDVIAEIGGDPFAIPNNADLSHPMVAKLDKMKFGFALKAKMGLPSGVAPASLPDIIRLDDGNARVRYQLYCAEFSVIALNQDSQNRSFINLQQSSASPWLFVFEVGFTVSAGDQNAINSLPPPVQQRLKTLSPNSVPRVLQLRLNYKAASLQQSPTIQGLDPASDAYASLARTFVPQLLTGLDQSGIRLGYVVMSMTPVPNQPSVAPTDFAVEVSPHVDGQGNPTTSYGLYTLDFLVMSNRRPMPPPVPFNWNWIDASQVANYHGATSIRRDVFLDYLLALLNRNAAGLCIDPNVELHHSGERYSVRYSWSGAPQPTSFAKVAPVDIGGGYTRVMTFAYSHGSYDDSMAASHLSSINGTFNYAVNGDVAIGGGNKIRVTLHAIVFVEFVARQAGNPHTIVSGNQLNLTHVTTYEVAVDPDGRLVVTEATSDSGGNQGLNYGSDMLGVHVGAISAAAVDCANNASGRLRSAAGNFGNALASMIGNSQAWVYPGGKAIACKAVGFSSGLDLVTYVRLTAAG